VGFRKEGVTSRVKVEVGISSSDEVDSDGVGPDTSMTVDAGADGVL
jgi:hypothetical protein